MDHVRGSQDDLANSVCGILVHLNSKKAKTHGSREKSGHRVAVIWPSGDIFYWCTGLDQHLVVAFLENTNGHPSLKRTRIELSDATLVRIAATIKELKMNDDLIPQTNLDHFLPGTHEGLQRLC